MGAIQDFLTNATTFDTSAPREGISRVIHRQLTSIINEGDFDVPASCAATNEVQAIATHTNVASGNYTLTFTLHSGETFTTGNLAYNADAAAVENAIDSAATSASIAGWTNGDIGVGGSALSAGLMTFTFSGASVAGLNHGEVVINNVSLVGVGTAGAASTTTPGDDDPATDEVQSIAAHVAATGGTYVLSVLGNSTAAIAWNANAATIQTAVDLVSGVTAGHVAITGGPLSTTALTITFSGADVDETNQPQTTINGAGLTVTGVAGDESVTTSGQTARHAWAALVALGIILDSNLPEQGSLPSSITVVGGRGNFPHQLSDATVLAIVNEIASQDDESQAVKDALLTALGF